MTVRIEIKFSKVSRQLSEATWCRRLLSKLFWLNYHLEVIWITFMLSIFLLTCSTVIISSPPLTKDYLNILSVISMTNKGCIIKNTWNHWAIIQRFMKLMKVKIFSATHERSKGMYHLMKGQYRFRIHDSVHLITFFENR